MLTVIIFLSLIIGLNLIPLCIKPVSPNYELRIRKISFYVTIIFIVSNILLLCELRLKGFYSHEIILVIFGIAILIYFATVNNSYRKLWSIIFLTPLLAMGIIIQIFHLKTCETPLDESHHIYLRRGGFLSCGETLVITKSKLVIFDQAIQTEYNLCLRGVNHVELNGSQDGKISLLIHHDGEMDSENPFNFIFKLDTHNISDTVNE